LDQELLKELLNKVAEKFGYNDPESWQDGLFVMLSEDIEKETRFIISRNTLKRLYGKIKTSEHYNPQIETRNALARYAGFPDWNKYRMQILSQKAEKAGVPVETYQKEIKKEEEKAQPKRKVSRKKVWLGIAVLSVLGLLFGIYRYGFRSEPDYSGIKIQIQNPVDTAPFAIVVRYEIPEEIKDSLFLRFGGTSFYLPRDKKSFVHSLSRPNYSFIYLKTSNKTIRAIPVKAYSRNLECYYESGKVVLQVPQKEFLGGGTAGLKKTFFQGNRLDSLDFNSTFYKVKDYPVDGDNFSFHSRYRVDNSPKICHFFQVMLYADSGHHELRIHNKGCAQHNFVAPAELYFGGKYDDLTQLSTSKPGVWHEMEIRVRNKQYYLILDGKECFKARYKKTMGMLNVVRMQFDGFGQIDYFRLKDPAGRIVEQEEF
jgi:hypothetical protein